MEFKELVSPSLTDLFIQELQRMILSGELKIGERLPTERELIFDFYHTAALSSRNIILPLLLRTFMPVYQSMGSIIAQLGYLDDQIKKCESIYQAIIHGQAQDARDYDIQSIESCRIWIGTHYKPGERFYPPVTPS